MNTIELFFSIAFMLSPIYLTLEEVPPPPRIELGARSARSVSAFYDLPPFPLRFPLPNAMPEKETCEFQFQIDVGKLDLGNLH